jgi:hypothetical protein
MKKDDEKKEALQSKKSLWVQLTPRGTFGWFFLCFFISGWMFFLGILVGRGTMPVKFDIKKLEKELTVLKDAVIKEEQARISIDSNAISNKIGLDFYEALKNKGDDAGLKIDKPVDGSGRQKETLPVEVASVKKKERRYIKPRPVSTSQKNRIVAANNAEANPIYTIQVSSVKDPEAADRMVDKFKKMGYPAYRTQTALDGKGVWFRVRIGTFKNRAEACSTLDRLKKKRVDAILISIRGVN